MSNEHTSYEVPKSANDCLEVFIDATSSTSVLAYWHDGKTARSVGEVCREGETLEECTSRLRNVVLSYVKCCVFRGYLSE